MTASDSDEPEPGYLDGSDWSSATTVALDEAFAALSHRRRLRIL